MSTVIALVSDILQKGPSSFTFFCDAATCYNNLE